MNQSDAPYHAHVYYAPEERAKAATLRYALEANTDEILFAGPMTDAPVGPHPIAQFEVHFFARSVAAVTAAIKAAGLRALVHPLTDDDLADHTTLGQWIGEPLDLDLSVLDPPGENKGAARFGGGEFGA
jgi:aromatic ring-cleaving dioxygenase